MGTAGSVCAQPPAAQGLLDQFLASVRLFGGPGFWQVSDKVNPGSVNPGNGELQNWNSKFIPKRTAIHTKTLPETPPRFLTALRPQGESWGQGDPCCQPEGLTPAAPLTLCSTPAVSSPLHSPRGHCWDLGGPAAHLSLGFMPGIPTGSASSCHQGMSPQESRRRWLLPAQCPQGTAVMSKGGSFPGARPLLPSSQHPSGHFPQWSLHQHSRA